MAEARQEFPIEQQLRKDVREAQRARDQLRLDTLRMALGAIHNLEVARTDRKNAEYGKALTEADCLRVVEQEVKKRQQAIPLYEQGGRGELAEKERQGILERARAEQEQLLERARKEIEEEKEKALLALRREAVDLSIAAASKVIEQNLDSAANRKLVVEYLASLEKRQ